MTSIDVRPIIPADRSALARFACRSWSQPWTDEVEASIRHLVDELEHAPDLVTRALWVDSVLVAVAVWRRPPSTELCQSLILAVQNGHRRQGHARRLKELGLDEARRAGCTVVISKVHWDNIPMLQLNESFGANIVPIEGNRDYAHCIIAL